MSSKTIKKVSLADIRVDSRVQRIEGVDMKRVSRINGDFNPNALGVITVSARPDGSHIVLDGMHRTEFARHANYTKPLDAVVFSGLTLAQEAELFILLNDAKMPSAISKFAARVIMGDPVAVDIKRICDKHQWAITVNNEPGNLAAVHALERVYLNAGGTMKDGEYPDLTDRVLELLTIAWEWDRNSVDAALLLAVAQLLGRFGASVDSKKLTSEMQSTRPRTVVAKGKALRDAQGGTLPAAVAKVLVGMHNNKRRTNLLPDWVWIR